MDESKPKETPVDRDPVTNLFVKGNKAGGNKKKEPLIARKMDVEPPVDAIKDVMLAEYSVRDIRSMLRAQMTKAQTGDTNAAKFIRDGIWGKPKVSTTDKESSFISALMDYAESKTIIDTDNK